MAAVLQRLYNQAKQAARRRGQKLSTAHLVLAMFQNDRQAGVLMAQQGAGERELLEALDRVDDEPTNAVEIAIERAENAAATSGDANPGAVHLLFAIAGESRSAGHQCLESAGATPRAVRDDASAMLGLADPTAGCASPRPEPQVPQRADQRARSTRARLLRTPGSFTPSARPAARGQEPQRAKASANVSELKKAPENKRKEVVNSRCQNGGPRPSPIAPALFEMKDFPTLSAIGRNLSAAASAGEIDPVIGREREIEQLLDILDRRRANNPILVGAPGVGKTAIVEGLALYLARRARNGNPLSERAIVEVSVGSLLAGTGVRGALAEKLRALKSEVLAAKGRVLLFIDEIHDLVGSSDGSDGATNELKSALARGELPCIGATTDTDYRRLFERDPALARRFTRVDVEEPSADKAVDILKAVATQYEKHHGVAYHPAALEAAVEMSVRYLSGSQLPAKAIGIIDQAAARTRRRNGNVVDTKAIAEVISEQSSVPVDRLLMRDGERLLALDKHLEARVIGQRDAIAHIASALQKSAAGFRGRRPLGTFLFLGPTGVGKTEMAKSIHELLFPSGDFTRFDMSDFSESHSVARLLGAPPGYVGYEDGGQLTEAVRARPYQLLLLDEIEKAHPDVLLALLPLLDEGRLKDVRGRSVDFTNTVVAMTSNLGAQRLETKSRIGFSENGGGSLRENQKREALASARAALPPELWNRIDEPLYFYPLGRTEVAAIARRYIDQAAQITFERHQIKLEIDPSVFDALVAAGGFDPFLGARPMKRTVGRLVEAPLAAAILSGQLCAGDTVRLRGEGDAVCITGVNARQYDDGQLLP